MLEFSIVRFIVIGKSFEGALEDFYARLCRSANLVFFNKAWKIFKPFPFKKKIRVIIILITIVF
jgi:hypothetical protein